MNTDVITFGETMIRLSAPDKKRLEQAESFDVNIGGSESNVAVAISRLGLDTSFVTRLTENPLGRMVENKIREQGVDTSNIIWTEEDRVGKYYLEFGANPRPSSVIYDRANSAISNVKGGTMDWGSIFSGGKLFHTSGITPALSDSAREVTKESMMAAKEAGLLVSVDLNYRSKLWTQAEAKECMTELMDYTDILVTTEEDTERVFDITADTYEEVARKLTEEFDFEVVAITLRDNISMWRNDWTAIAYKDGVVYDDMTYELELVDRVGGGDSFTAGFLYGYLTGDAQKGVEYGNATSAIKQTNPGDINWCTHEEVKSLAEGGGRVRISR
uniref:Ribokinase-like domain-containing protein n=1 Tax=uncultured organism TaxID=155900 RepID=M1PPV4_9ZZZZ|nr:ribokinase-like domain-containing protein [uncultured organism]